MGVTVIVNKRTVVHPSSGGAAYASSPDICKTPTPGGPVPIPYPNTAFSINTAQGSKTVQCDGHAIMLKGAVFSMSIADEAGSIGGIASGVFKGKATFVNYSFDVKFEAKNVPRLADPMLNNGNQYNAVTTAAKNNPLFAEAIDILCKEMCDVWKTHGGTLKPGQQYQRILAERLKNNPILKKMGFEFEQRVWGVVAKGAAGQWGRRALQRETVKRVARALGQKIIGEGVEQAGEEVAEFVVKKAVTKIGSRLIPYVGWALFAWDVVEVIAFIPDAVQIVKGVINQCFEFKFPGDVWGPGQAELQKLATEGLKDSVELTVENCDCT